MWIFHNLYDKMIWKFNVSARKSNEKNKTVKGGKKKNAF